MAPSMNDHPWPDWIDPSRCIASGPFHVLMNGRQVETGTWLRWESDDRGQLWCVYASTTRYRSWVASSIFPAGGAVVAERDDGKVMFVPAPEIDYDALIDATSDYGPPSREGWLPRSTTFPPPSLPVADAPQTATDGTGEQVLSDKFVIPGETVEWLDPSLFPPVGVYGPPIQRVDYGYGDDDLDGDLAEPGAEILPDGWARVASNGSGWDLRALEP